MKYNPTGKSSEGLYCAITYGSRLYGTNTPTSDHDFKAVYLPSRRTMLLGKKADVKRFRFDAVGEPVGHQDTMPDNGHEAEHTPVQKFVADWFSGQAYAVEMVFAVLQGYAEGHAGWPHPMITKEFTYLCENLATNFRTKNVNGMVGFAVKQTFDYVRRGERLNFALHVLEVLKAVQDEAQFENPNLLRLDTLLNGEAVLDRVARITDLKIGYSENNHRVFRTLELNGRQYLETTTLVDLVRAVKKLADQYGDRSTLASQTDVDWKSLSHAVRVYQQVLEYLDTGVITFPRPNAAELLKIKSAQVNLSDVKTILADLDDEVQAKLLVSTLPDATPELEEELMDELYEWLEFQYN